MDFLYPERLYGLLLIPLIVGLYILARYRRKVKIRRFGQHSAANGLMPQASGYKPVIKLILQLCAVVCLVIAVARPRGGEKEITENREGIEVMIAVDVSRSMLASSTDDSKGISRMERAKLMMSRLVDKISNDRIGVVVFAAEASTQLPLVTDGNTAKKYINDISVGKVATQGTDIGLAIETCLYGFTDDKNVGKAIVIITDIEDNENRAVEAARVAHENGIQIDVIGVGSTQGVPIPVGNGDFLRDHNGQYVSTALSPEAGNAIAEAGGGIYVNSNDNNAIDDIAAQLDKLTAAGLGEVTYKAAGEKFPIFIWLAFGFLIIDLLILDRKIVWLQKINFFTKAHK